MSLKEIFDSWENAHKKESPESLKKTVPCQNGKKVDRRNFIEDGCYSEDKETAKYLYILKEANLEFDYKKDSIIYEGRRPNSWFREDSKEAKSMRSKMIKKFSIVDSKSSTVNLSDIAYMNINKRGGLSHCNETTLSEYAKVYKKQIKEEIDFLSPEYVICCNICYEILLNEVIDKEVTKETSDFAFRYNNALFIRWWHPNASKSNNGLIKIMNELNSRK